MKKCLSLEHKTTDRKEKNAELLRKLDIYRNLVEATTDSIYTIHLMNYGALERRHRRSV